MASQITDKTEQCLAIAELLGKDVTFTLKGTAVASFGNSSKGSVEAGAPNVAVNQGSDAKIIIDINGAPALGDCCAADVSGTGQGSAPNVDAPDGSTPVNEMASADSPVEHSAPNVDAPDGSTPVNEMASADSSVEHSAPNVDAPEESTPVNEMASAALSVEHSAPNVDAPDGSAPVREMKPVALSAEHPAPNVDEPGVWTPVREMKPVALPAEHPGPDVDEPEVWTPVREMKPVALSVKRTVRTCLSAIGFGTGVLVAVVGVVIERSITRAVRWISQV